MATLLILGTCFLVIVAGVYLVRLLRWEKIRKLQHQGKRVLAIVTSVQLECEERGPAEFPLLNYCYYIEADVTISKRSGPIPRRETPTCLRVTA